ncbi:monocarboxylate transporter 2 isoform X1 [Anolis carolinensis]|uniref:Major facilitator superfamily (MFS) profile domain-containing protein n=1 Tax=Anolis carolinensis TaxID=28377 RepID=G1KQP7_ANOCA|nr:PREDICTED: monocarboxylate transporter 2 [Anolis carolinensis]|eukprot:XP_008103608.1 PREDICTED: monocarboxylate transporter 2 [Anolis carolinensis]
MPPPAEKDLAYTPPDGGWGWAVVLGAFVSIGFSYAFPKGIAIFFKEIQDFFGTSYSEIAWVSSIMLAAMYGGGPLSSILVNRFGSRPVVMFGGLLCGIGMVSASFCTSIFQLYICAGLITGLGLAFNLQPSVIIIGKYFLKRRPVANGLAMAGSPVMLCTLAPLNQLLFDMFGWRGSFFILGALLLNCCVAGALFRPIRPPAGPPKGPANKQATETLQKEQPDLGLVEVAGEEEKEDKNCCENFNRFLDFSLFKHRGFLIYLIGNVLMFLGFFAPIVFLAPYAKHLGIDEYSAAFLLSILAIVDMIARPTTGIIANSKWVRPKIQYFFSFSIAFNGACHLLCPLATGYSGLVVYSVFFGLAFGMVCAMLFETLMDLVGASRFTSAVGLVTIVECCTILLGPPIGGTLIDTFGDYKYMFIKCGSVMVLAGIFLFIMNYYNYRMLAKEEKARRKHEAEKKDDEAVRTPTLPGEENTTKVEKMQDGHEAIPLRTEEEGLKNGAQIISEA